MPHCCQSGCLSNPPFFPDPNNLKKEIFLLKIRGNRKNAMEQIAKKMYFFG
jgi:hypothetical protein